MAFKITVQMICEKCGEELEEFETDYIPTETELGNRENFCDSCAEKLYDEDRREFWAAKGLA